VGGGLVVDKHIGWKLKKLWIPVVTFAGMDNNGTSTISLSQGTPTLEPITTSELAGVPMDTADEVAHIFPIPWDLNREKKVYARLWFQHASTDADTPGFIVTSKFFGRTDAMTEFIAGADVSTTFAAHTCSTNAASLEVTVWTDLSWESYLTSTDMAAAISVELNALGSATADECKLLGIELGYEIEATDITGRHRSQWEAPDAV